jgi:protein gp37
MRMYAFRTADYLAIDGNRLPEMEDLDTVLQLLRSGRKNAVLFYYAQGHLSSNAPGGCSHYRTADTHHAVCQQLQQLHPEFVRLRRKVSATDQNGFGTRTEVTIQWQRAAASSAVALSPASAAVPRLAERNPGSWWWDASWNVSGGCRCNGPGCLNCFAPARAGTLHQQSGVGRRVDTLYAGTVRRTAGGRYVFNGRQSVQPPGHDSWTWPLTWPGAKHPVLGPGQPSLIFVSDMSDLFYELRPKSIIDRTLGTIVASNHIGLVCTRRVERMAEYFLALPPSALPRWRSHLWLGFSAENQAYFDSRWPVMRLLAEAGFVVFVSIAPMLGPVVLPRDFLVYGPKAWVICSGEQRCPGVPRDRTRHMHPNWARAIRDQCAPANVAFFLKQMSKKGPIPPDLQIRQFPRPAAATGNVAP